MTQRSGRARCVGRQVQGVVACRPPDPHRLPQPDGGCAGSEATTSPKLCFWTVVQRQFRYLPQRQPALVYEASRGCILSWYKTIPWYYKYVEVTDGSHVQRYGMIPLYSNPKLLLISVGVHNQSSIFFHMRPSEPLLTHIIASKVRICCASI